MGSVDMEGASWRSLPSMRGLAGIICGLLVGVTELSSGLSVIGTRRCRGDSAVGDDIETGPLCMALDAPQNHFRTLQHLCASFWSCQGRWEPGEL